MIVAALNVYRYSLPLVHPFFVKGVELNNREGLILRLIGQSGAEGFGEIAPLPGFSEESLLECQQQLKGVCSFLLSEPLPEHLDRLDGKFSQWLQGLELHRAVRFGLEMAILNLIANERRLQVNQLLTDNHHNQIRVNGLLQGNTETVISQAKDLLADGFHALKLKIGSEDIEADIKKVQALSEVINGKALLHLDANQAWDLDQAIHFGKEVGLATIDYIEEPLKDAQQIPEFFSETLIPSALDESVLGLEFSQIREIDGVDFLILKPSIIGSIEHTWELMNQANMVALDPVISSAFESDFGILTLAQLAGCTSRDHSAGIDTLKWFEESLLNEPLLIEHGKMNIEGKSIQSSNIRYDMLTEAEL